MHRRLLESRPDLGSVSVPQDLPQRAIHRHADKRDDLGPELRDFPFEDQPAVQVLLRLDDVDARTRPSHQIGHPDTPLRQPHVIFVSDRFGDDAGFIQKAPEAIGRPCEMMTSRR